LKLLKIQKAGGSWQRLVDDWTSQCEHYGEEFANYAVATMPVLEQLAANPEQHAGVYATETNGHISSVCQLNRTPLPGFDAPVLRVRLLTVSPRYDFGDFDISDYGEVLIAAFAGVLNISDDSELNSRYINFHLRSPSDRPFFQALGAGLNGAATIEAVKLAGSWLYITKK